MRRLPALAALVTLIGAIALTQATAAPVETTSYIVVLEETAGDPGAVAATQAAQLGFTPSLVYSSALHGYAAELSEDAVTALRSSPGVAFLQEDGRNVALGGAQAPPQPPQLAGNGVLRIDGDESSAQAGNGRGRVKINVAIIDDGMDTEHPDLNAKKGTDCVPRDPEVEPGWHGTMVGGFAAALDNRIGRVGIAPGATVWAVRVLDSTGFGTDSEIICGIDWVTSTRTDRRRNNDIAVANMSLGREEGEAFHQEDDGNCGRTNGDALHLAICNSVAAGVTYVAAAGNESDSLITPAAFQEVLASTAMGDRDGQPGGLGGQFVCEPAQFDDWFAFFSNFVTLTEDRAHTVAASGVCISSTYPGGLYAVGSGTSFSTPHVTGVVALCIAFGACGGLTPPQIVAKVVGDAEAFNTAHPDYGFVGDPFRPVSSGGYYGYLVNAGIY